MGDTNADGKNYVISDIHGMYGSYAEVMKLMRPQDHLYILGDVIDRGKGGIQILQDIMKRQQNPQTNPKITFLLGNHELQFLETVTIIKKHELQQKDLHTIINRANNQKHVDCYRNWFKDTTSKEYQRVKQEFDKYDEEFQNLGLNTLESNIIQIWLTSNKGDTTIFDFLIGGRVKNVEEQNAICRFLYNSYVALPQNINGKDYLFVHAMPPKDYKILNDMKQNQKGYRLTDLPIEQNEFMLQERENSTYEQAKEIGFTTICGHTPKKGKIIVDSKRGFVMIDAGCGHKQRHCKLALYCIDTGKAKYFDEKEALQEPQEL